VEKAKKEANIKGKTNKNTASKIFNNFRDKNGLQKYNCTNVVESIILNT